MSGFALHERSSIRDQGVIPFDQNKTRNLQDLGKSKIATAQPAARR